MRWILAIPFVMILGFSFLPSINGPYLWFGLPSLLVWTLGWSLLITLFLWIYDNYAGERDVE